MEHSKILITILSVVSLLTPIVSVQAVDPKGTIEQKVKAIYASGKSKNTSEFIERINVINAYLPSKLDLAGTDQSNIIAVTGTILSRLIANFSSSKDLRSTESATALASLLIRFNNITGSAVIKNFDPLGYVSDIPPDGIDAKEHAVRLAKVNAEIALSNLQSELRYGAPSWAKMTKHLIHFFETNDGLLDVSILRQLASSMWEKPKT